MEACRTTKEEDPYFVYDIAMDQNDKVENIAWSYGESVQSYTAFGDVVYFDTTYRSITYGMLFGAWLGIDNKGKTVFFGGTLLQDETPRSFVWALQVNHLIVFFLDHFTFVLVFVLPLMFFAPSLHDFFLDRLLSNL